jgi:twitching motility protein PilU
MADKQASDLFVTTGAPIQIKINGVVMPVNAQTLDAATAKRVIYELMSEQQARDFESLHEMNFGFSKPEFGNFRVNVFRQRGSASMVIRYVKPDVPSFEELKLPAVLKEIVMDKLGLIMVVGSTGSGKSTTLASMIDYRNSTRPGHILTIEDPIEFQFRHKKSIVNQREVGLDTKSYEHALISAMREAPDMLMIGEIRDIATLKTALLFAQTGHLCLSTLHANNSYHALNRIINFFPREQREPLFADLAISLKAVVSQRLIRTKTGDRVPAVEVLLNTKHISELIKNGEISQIKDAMEQSMAPGCQTFEQALFHLYSSDQITLEEALANSDSPTNLHWLISNADQSGGGQQQPAQNSSTTSTQASDDLSSIKLNLDTV